MYTLDIIFFFNEINLDLIMGISIVLTVMVIDMRKHSFICDINLHSSKSI